MAQVVVIGCSPLLAGCESFKLYDKTKAAVADDAKKKYDAIKVDSIIDQSIKNLDAMLAKEIEIVRSDFDLRLDRALLQIVGDDTSAAEWHLKRMTEFKELGFAKTDDLRTYVDGRDKYESALLDANFFAAEVESLAGINPPPCVLDQELPESWTPGTLPSDERTRTQIRTNYDLYRNTCAEAKLAHPSPPAAGKIGDVVKDVSQSRARLSSEAQEARKIADEVVAAQAAYQKAQSEAEANPTAEGIKALRRAATDLRDALATASKTAAVLGVEEVPLAYAEQINTILTAIAKGELDKTADTQDESVKDAALIAATLPSLAEDAGALIEAGRKPTVSNLLIELNHQSILLQRAREIIVLRQRELSLHDAKLAALVRRAASLRQVHLRACALAMLAAGGAFKRDSCDEFSVEISGSEATCNFPQRPPVRPCILGKKWSSLLKDSSLASAQKREMYGLFVEYSRALKAQADATEIDFRIIDVAHRRTAASNRGAILAWNNLVSVPVTQLDAYHGSGISPDALAGAIANLLGLGGIAGAIAK